MSPDDLAHAANTQTADLLRMVLIAIGAAIVGIGGFIAWIVRAALPRFFVQGDKTILALETIAASGQALPHVLEAERLKTVVSVTDVVREEAEGLKSTVANGAQTILAELKQIDSNGERRMGAVARVIAEHSRELVRLGVDPERLPPLDSITPPAEEAPSSVTQGRQRLETRPRH